MIRNTERTGAVPKAKVWTKGLAALALVGALGASLPATAGASEPMPAASISVGRGEMKSLQLGVGRSMIVDLAEDAQEIFVGDPKIANAIVRSPRRLYITTLTAGQTTIFALGPNGRKIAVFEISVGRDVGELTRLLSAAIPKNDIHVRTVGGSIILTGSVDSAGDAQRALDIAQGFVADGGLSAVATGGLATATTNPAGKVINSLLIRGLDQVSLRVTISEIRRDVLKQLGVSYAGLGPNASGGFGSGVPGLNITNPLAVNGALGNSATIGWNMAGEKLAATLNAFEQEGVSRTLAEPTVTAVSGERAKFLAGGTIPIPASESCTTGICQLSFVQQPYGVTLNFTPVVLSQGRIQLRVATEVTDIDYSKQITIASTSIPGFRTRKNETTVELPSGGSIVSAGLISTQSSQAITGLPALMNLPVLGALFRSRDYQRQETELLIIVTPYIVHAVDPKDVSRPDQNFTDASDPQSWFLGRVNRIYSSSGGLRPMPNYTGKVGFITD
jgi:pilus assembly protein CpaC